MKPDENIEDLPKLFTIFFSGSFSFLMSYLSSLINGSGSIPLGFFAIGYIIYCYLFAYFVMHYLKKTFDFVGATITKYLMWYVLAISFIIVLVTLIILYLTQGMQATINNAANLIMVVVGGVIIFALSKIFEAFKNTNGS